MRPPVPVLIGSGGTVNNNTTISNDTSSVIVSKDAGGNPNIQAIINETLALNIDNRQNVQIGTIAAETATTSSSRLVVSAPYGQCIQLINETVNNSGFLEVDASGGLAFSSTGANVNMENNKVYISPNSLYIDRGLVTSTAEQLNYLSGATPGIAVPLKALVVDNNRNIANIGALSASTLTGTLLTGAQPNITSLNNVNITTLQLNSVNVLSTAAEINYLNTVIPGTAKRSHALVVDDNYSIANIGSLSATSLTGTLLTGAQPNITSIGTLSALNINGYLGVGTTTPSRSLDIVSSAPSIRLTRGVFTLELSLDADGSTKFSSSKDIYFDANRNIYLGGTGSILGVNTITANTLTGRLQTPDQPNITSIGTLSTLTSTGDVTIGLSTPATNSHRVIISESNGNLIKLVRSSYKCELTINNVGDFVISPVGDLILSSGASLLMNGSIEGITDLAATTLTGKLLTSEQPNITSVGVLSSLTVQNGVVASTVSATSLTGTLLSPLQTNITAVGTLSSLTVQNGVVASTVSASTLTGTILTPLQPNITTIGTLASLTVQNNITANAVVASSLTGTILTASQPNITTIGALTSLRVQEGITSSAVTATSLTGTLLTPAQPNITTIGTLSSLTVENGITSSAVTATSLTGTLLTPAQPNVTSVGTLSSLAVQDDIAASTIAATTLSGLLLTPDQPNIVSIGTLQALTVMAPIGIGMPVPLCAVDINTFETTIIPEIRIDNGTEGGYIGVNSAGLYLDSSTGIITLSQDVGLVFSGGSLTGLTSLSVASLGGTLTTPIQRNITSVGTLDYLDTQTIGIGVAHSTDFKLTIANPSGQMVKYDNGSVSMTMGVCPCGTYTFTPSNLELALGTNVNLVFRGGTIIGLDTLTATNLYGQIQDSYQPKITALGPLTSLTVIGAANLASVNVSGSAYIAGDLTVEGALNLTTPLQSSSTMSGATGRYDANVPAISSTNGGTFTVIGGAAFSKNVIIGETLTVGTATISDSDIVPIQGYVAGTVVANRILVPDTNKDLSGFRNLAATNLIGLIQTACQPNINQVGDLLTLNVNGYLGVGTSTPSVQLEVNSTTGNCLCLSYDKLRYACNMNLGVDEFGNGSISTSGPSLTLSSTLKTNKIMLGNTTSSDIPMEIGYTPFIIRSSYAYNTSSNSHGVMNPANGLAYNYSIRALGRILCTQSLDVMSDQRTKKNITPLTDEYCSSFVSATTPVSFNWITGETHKSFGYIAQDLIRAGFPELVNLVEDTEVEEVIDDDGFISPAGVKFTVTYEHVIPILAKNQKRLMEENAELRAKLDLILEMLGQQP